MQIWLSFWVSIAMKYQGEYHDFVTGMILFHVLKVQVMSNLFGLFWCFQESVFSHGSSLVCNNGRLGWSKDPQKPSVAQWFIFDFISHGICKKTPTYPTSFWMSDSEKKIGKFSPSCFFCPLGDSPNWIKTTKVTHWKFNSEFSPENKPGPKRKQDRLSTIIFHGLCLGVYFTKMTYCWWWRRRSSECTRKEKIWTPI